MFVLVFFYIFNFKSSSKGPPQAACAEPKPNDFFKIKPIQMTLSDLIRTDQCDETTSLEMIEIPTPNVQRLETEATILIYLHNVSKYLIQRLKKIHLVQLCMDLVDGNYNVLIDTREYEYNKCKRNYSLLNH